MMVSYDKYAYIYILINIYITRIFNYYTRGT